VDDSVIGAAPPDTPSSPHPFEATGLLALVNGVLVGVASVYLATSSVVITLIAGVAAIGLAALTLIIQRRQP
jgi:hypothetical protein